MSRRGDDGYNGWRNNFFGGNPLPVTAIIGAQWGDEGKGGVVDYLAQDADAVVRFQGGANAGHTVIYKGEPLALHLLPCGIVHERPICVIANGVVVDLEALIEEIRLVGERGMSVTPQRLKISDRAHLTLPYHRLLDGQRESADSPSRIGTTQRGVGPTYVDKVDRIGIRFLDFIRPDDLKKKLKRNWEMKAGQCGSLAGGGEVTAETLLHSLLSYYETVVQYAEVTDTVVVLNQMVADGKRILLEGAQGTGLDVDFGTYPYVTSSSTTAGGACIGTGIPPSRITQVFGVAKAYTTRVGEGPFPTEMTAGIQEEIRRRGREYGATTGRPRRCGWFDAVLVRYARMINGFTGLILTKLDILSGLPEVPIAVAYEWQGRHLTLLPADTRVLAECKPVYEILPGWTEIKRSLRKWSDLPDNARRFADRISQLAGVPVAFVSIGPERDAVLFPDEADSFWG